MLTDKEIGERIKKVRKEMVIRKKNYLKNF